MNDKMISENTANNVSAELSARRSGGDNMRHVAKHKRINAAAVVLTVIIVVLVCALAVSLVIIDKLHKKIFSRRIFFFRTITSFRIILITAKAPPPAGTSMKP